MNKVLETPLDKLFGNPFGATLMMMEGIALAIGVLAFARIALTSTNPPTGTLVIIPMYFLGRLAGRYNRGLYMGDREAYNYPSKAGKAKGFLLLGLGFAVVALGAYIATLGSF